MRSSAALFSPSRGHRRRPGDRRGTRVRMKSFIGSSLAVVLESSSVPDIVSGDGRRTR